MKKTIFIIFYFSFFTFHFSFSQSWLWGRMGIGSGFAESVASDGQGNCYFSGLFIDTLNFSGSILTDNMLRNPYGSSMFLTKFDNTGNLLWARQSINYGNETFGDAGRVAIDKTGNAYVSATFKDTAILGPDTLIFNSSIVTTSYYLVKYSSNGSFRWASTPELYGGDTSGVWASDVSTDKYGNVCITGLLYADTVYFGSQYILGNRHIGVPFLVKYDSTGNALWAKAASGNTYINNGGEGMCVSNDKNGNAYITGIFEDSIWFGSQQLISITYSGVEFLAKYTPGGTVVWAKQAFVASNSSSSVGEALITDAPGNIYVAGEFQDTVAFGAYTLVANNVFPQTEYSIFLVKYDSTGTVLWAKQGEVLDSNGWSVGTISIDNYKHIYLSIGRGRDGHCKIAFGNDTLSLYDTSKYDAASIILKFDSNGNLLCSAFLQGAGAVLNAISSDTSGNYVYFGGTTSTIMIFGNDTINPFSYPANQAIAECNFPPFIARWGGCDSNITTVIPKESITKDVKVYPNPNNGNFILSLSNINEKCNVEIYNMFGEQVLTETLPPQTPKGALNSINLSGEPNGVYLYRVMSEDGSLVGSGKVVIEK